MKDNKIKIENLLKDKNTFERVLNKDQEDLDKLEAKRKSKNPFKKISRAFGKAMLIGEINEYQNKLDKTKKKLKGLGWTPKENNSKTSTKTNSKKK